LGHKGGIPKNEKYLIWVGLRGVWVSTHTTAGEAALVLVDVVGSWNL
jgi:hypothetical protein